MHTRIPPTLLLYRAFAQPPPVSSILESRTAPRLKSPHTSRVGMWPNERVDQPVDSQKAFRDASLMREFPGMGPDAKVSSPMVSRHLISCHTHILLRPTKRNVFVKDVLATSSLSSVEANMVSPRCRGTLERSRRRYPWCNTTLGMRHPRRFPTT